MSSPTSHTAQPRSLVSRSPGTAESRTGGAAYGCLDQPCSSPNPTVSVPVQDTMARVKQTARDPHYQEADSGGVPPIEEEPAVRGSPGGTPSTPGDSILEETPGCTPSTSGDNVEETAVQGKRRRSYHLFL